MAHSPKARDDGPVSEVTILPDGRVYLFGLTRPMLDVLATLPVRESGWAEFHREQTADAPSEEPPT